MTLPVAFYYDRSTKENVRLSDNIVEGLASRGIAFEYSRNNFIEPECRGTPILLISGAIYGPKNFKRDGKDILDLAQKVDFERRKSA